MTLTEQQLAEAVEAMFRVNHHPLAEASETEWRKLQAALTAALPIIEPQWQPIETAPKDGTYIIAVVAPSTSRFLQHHEGRAFVIRHEGFLGSGYNMGWAVYPGYGGAPDGSFTHWMPLPAPPAIRALAEEAQG